MSRVHLKPAGILLLLMTLQGPARADVEDEDWYRYEAANFILYSSLPEEEVAGRIRDLEAFRALVHQIFGVAERDMSGVPTKILLLSEPAHMRRVFQLTGYAGLMSSGLRYNLLVVSNVDESKTDVGNEIAYHEYVHHLVSNASSFRYPIWFNEGFADALSTTTVNEDHAILGRAPAWRTSALSSHSDMPLRILLAVESTFYLSPEQAERFYARSWLFVHYLLFSQQTRETQLKASLEQFLAAFNTGLIEEDSFAEIFGMSVAEMDRRLAAYEAEGLPYGKLDLSGISFDPDYRRSAMSRGEISYELAYMTIVPNPKYAQKLFKKALRESPRDPRYLAGRGVQLQFDGRYRKGERLARRALASAPGDYLVHVELSELILARCSAKERSEACNNPSVLEESHELTRRAYELQPDLLETKARYGIALLTDKQYEASIRMLEDALRLSPSSLEVVKNLGMAYAGIGDIETARTYLKRALAWSIDTPEENDRIQTMLDEISSDELSDQI